MAPTSMLLQGKAALRTPAGALRGRMQPQRLQLHSKLSSGRRGCAQQLGRGYSPGFAGGGGGGGPAGPPNWDRPTRAGPSPHAEFCGAAPEGRGLGFGFLQTPRPEGNRGVSGNRAGNAEVRAAAWGGGRAPVQYRGSVALWKFQEELGKTGPGKAPPECTCPSPHPVGFMPSTETNAGLELKTLRSRPALRSSPEIQT
ncbi:collagen alpha-1(III) chain-like [Acinonyx jubatus]|uniref:Collagen alpha-1(III) chain-like n=1 Tax=Acinonyx jubatus TaxID=32536 RepID=A0ABM3PYP3_ACIJB|nr:collagen alpha-1(III) chain-like [Acinonyx jubatus]